MHAMPSRITHTGWLKGNPHELCALNFPARFTETMWLVECEDGLVINLMTHLVLYTTLRYSGTSLIQTLDKIVPHNNSSNTHFTLLMAYVLSHHFHTETIKKNGMKKECPKMTGLEEDATPPEKKKSQSSSAKW